jgi:hypothetical protein
MMRAHTGGGEGGSFAAPGLVRRHAFIVLAVPGLFATIARAQAVVPPDLTPPREPEVEAISITTGLRADLFASMSALSASGIAVTALPVVSRLENGASLGPMLGAPGVGLPADGFAVRWTGRVRAPASGAHKFRVRADDGVRLWVNGVLVINSWGPAALRTVSTSPITLSAGQWYDVRVDYADWSGASTLHLEWRTPGIAWFREIPAVDQRPFSGPTTIMQGGTYVGSWESADPNTDVIQIATTQPVVIARSLIRGVTQGDNDARGLVRTAVFDADMRFEDVTFHGLRPPIANAQQARLLNTLNIRRLHIENCSIIGTNGVRVLNFDNHPPAEFIRVLRCRARNIDGRRTDDRGGYIPWSIREHIPTGQLTFGSFGGSFFHLNAVADQPNVEVAWNAIINEPFKSTTEDIFSIYSSGGTPDSPLYVHDNFIWGGYTASPDRVGDVIEGDFVYRYTHTGTGMNLGDNGTPLPVGHVRCSENQVVATTNVGILFAGGFEVQVYRNRVVASGRLPDGRPNRSNFAGIVGWDFYNTGPTLFFENIVRDNYSAWAFVPDDAAFIGRNDYEYRTAGFDGLEPDPLDPLFPVPGITTLSNMSGPTPTLAHERAEFALWVEKCAANQVHVGSRHPLLPPTPLGGPRPPVTSPRRGSGGVSVDR